MPRRGLGDLADQATTELATGPTPVPTTPRRAVTETAVGEGPHYLTLIRKEARVRDDQAADLADLTRKLNKTRAGAGERITDNTLIRVAIDLLLERRGDLVGASETELRNSVCL